MDGPDHHADTQDVLVALPRKRNIDAKRPVAGERPYDLGWAWRVTPGRRTAAGCEAEGGPGVWRGGAAAL